MNAPDTDGPNGSEVFLLDTNTKEMFNVTDCTPGCDSVVSLSFSPTDDRLVFSIVDRTKKGKSRDVMSLLEITFDSMTGEPLESLTTPFLDDRGRILVHSSGYSDWRRY